MPNPTPTVSMILARAGEVEWRPPMQQTSGQPPVEPRVMDLSALESELGYQVLIPQLIGVNNIASAWVPALTTYFANLSPGALTAYNHETGDRTFQIVQRQILSSNQPMMFIYGDSVNAQQVMINGGLATVVIPLFEGPLRFAVWVSGDKFAWITFSWPVSEETVIDVVESLA